MPQQLVTVRWAPSWEPEDSVGGTDALTDWQQLQQHHDAAIPADMSQRPDGALTDKQKQGIRWQQHVHQPHAATDRCATNWCLNTNPSTHTPTLPRQESIGLKSEQYLSASTGRT
jgi:hypothetical protein